jgi:hypothetical protein
VNVIWDRLAAWAERCGQPLEEVLRHYVLEGVLRRVAQLPNAADFVLRGSMLTRAWVAPRRRAAQDLDFVGTFAHDVGETARRFLPAMAAGGDDAVCIDAASLRASGIWLKTAFPGVRLSVRAGFGTADRLLQIDVGFNDPLVPPPYRWDYPTLLPGSPLQPWCVRPETAAAWKLHGLAEMGPHGWRPKDLADLDLILQAMPLVHADLVAALRAAFLSRGYTLADAVAVFTTAEWWPQKSARVKWTAFRRAQPECDVADDLSSVVQGVHVRLLPALAAL